MVNLLTVPTVEELEMANSSIQIGESLQTDNLLPAPPIFTGPSPNKGNDTME